jgi:hypothetical protein
MKNIFYGGLVNGGFGGLSLNRQRGVPCMPDRGGWSGREAKPWDDGKQSPGMMDRARPSQAVAEVFWVRFECGLRR